MLKIHLIFNLILLFVGVHAIPTENNPPERVTLAKRATCTPASIGDTQQDDTPAIAAAIASCVNGGTIVIPAGKVYSLRTMLDFTGCVNCDFQLEGTLKSSTDTTYWSTQPAIIYFKSIVGAKFRSLTGTGLIDANG
jgi:galacturan 1,4-alpha-galacturonidase